MREGGGAGYAVLVEYYISTWLTCIPLDLTAICILSLFMDDMKTTT